MSKQTNCGKVFEILKDGKPHQNFSIIDRFGGGNFALAARIRNLKEQGFSIKSGPPQEFGKERQKQGEWWYQLCVVPIISTEPETHTESVLRHHKEQTEHCCKRAKNFAKRIASPCTEESTGKALTLEFMHRFPYKEA